jgi:hypothetical protein
MLKIFFTLLFIFSFSIVSICQSGDEKTKIEKKSYYELWLEKRRNIELPEKDGFVTFEKVDSIRVSGKSKGDLVTAFKLTLSDILRQAKSAIDVEDREGGFVAKVYDNYSFKYGRKIYFRPLHYTIKFQSKDGRLRIQLTNIEVGIDALEYNGYTIDTKTIFTPIEVRERIVSSSKNYKSLSYDGKARSLVIRKALRDHLLEILNGLVDLSVKRANESF